MFVVAQGVGARDFGGARGTRFNLHVILMIWNRDSLSLSLRLARETLAHTSRASERAALTQ